MVAAPGRIAARSARARLPSQTESENMVTVIAHRGASGVAPENTMAAFQRALDIGADGIELDCQLSMDGQLIVFHDSTPDRTAGAPGFIKDMTAAQLQELDAGSWFDDRFASERIPLLADVLELVRDRCRLNIEIKNLPFRYDGIEAAVVELIAATRFPVDDVIISSFDHGSLQTVAALQPRLPLAPLFAHYPTSFAAMPGDIVHPHWGVINADFVAEAQAAGKTINVWTANEPDQWEYLVTHGVNGIITDHPDKLRAWLSERTI